MRRQGTRRRQTRAAKAERPNLIGSQDAMKKSALALFVKKMNRSGKRILLAATPWLAACSSPSPAEQVAGLGAAES
jgi:hypothetical protein